MFRIRIISSIRTPSMHNNTKRNHCSSIPMSTKATRNTNMLPTKILPLSHLCKSSRKPANTKTPISSVLPSVALLDAPSPDANALPSGESFLLEMHRRRELSFTPSQKMTRKEREYLDKAANPSKHMVIQELSLPTKLARLTKKERDLFLQKALDLWCGD
jgi:hypothetical protein